DSTLTVILVLALRACTNAPRNPALSGPVTVPEMVAAGAAAVARIVPAMPAANHVNDRMASSRGFHVFGWGEPITRAGEWAGAIFCRPAPLNPRKCCSRGTTPAPPPPLAGEGGEGE